MEPEQREDQHARDQRETKQSPSSDSTPAEPHLPFASEGLEQVRGGHC
ncbi:hypothetical protein ACVWXO_006897 [Bradyrhizobium sp. LM2.7]